MRAKIFRKEAKESNYWLRLINLMAEYDDNVEWKHLFQESTEIKKIFSSIINKSS